MRENMAFDGYPTTSELQEHLDLYFQSCSITVNCQAGAIMAATMANMGECPITQEKVLDPDVAKDALAIMYTCGMYDFSGQFSFQIGLPAKSGVSGAVMLCIPHVGGLCIWSPPLDKNGNSVKAVRFCQEFAQKTGNQYHMFNRLTQAALSAPIKIKEETRFSKEVYVQRLLHGAAQFPMDEFVLLFEDIRVVSLGDFEKRTPLHLAAATGQVDIVRYILSLGVNPNPKDRYVCIYVSLSLSLSLSHTHTLTHTLHSH
eukprot:GSChrysophyteH2.ASY1.ANO1.1060.1 assembled CDS